MQIFKTMEKSEFCVLIKHCFLMVKILFKQSNGLIRVIQTLFHQKQWLRGSMLTLNAVVQIQMIVNTQVNTKKLHKLVLADHKLKGKWYNWGVDIRRKCIDYFAWTFVNEKAVFKVGAAFAHIRSKTTKCWWLRVLFATVLT